MKEDLVLFCNAKEFESNEIVDFIVLSGMFFIYIYGKETPALSRI